MILLDKKPFSKKIRLSDETLSTLFSSLPKLKNQKKDTPIKVIKEEKYDQLIIENWKHGVYSLDKKELIKIVLILFITIFIIKFLINIFIF